MQPLVVAERILHAEALEGIGEELRRADPGGHLSASTVARALGTPVCDRRDIVRQVSGTVRATAIVGVPIASYPVDGLQSAAGRGAGRVIIPAGLRSAVPPAPFSTRRSAASLIKAATRSEATNKNKIAGALEGSDE